jgi:hypothetical protein
VVVGADARRLVGGGGGVVAGELFAPQLVPQRTRPAAQRGDVRLPFLVGVGRAGQGEGEGAGPQRVGAGGGLFGLRRWFGERVAPVVQAAERG